ncbi:gamma-glutamyl-gamma-aminobutyrate hydrolase family protein [Halanaerobiaceae bacterium Z-7014]|uniref:Gamma-glutamyl-gamma-aminobutyrate hydrolase family protein n=1 Tax=Halonatronomonas betaini TaxID=2778430 RepID=A0A931F7H4_9FIRM|nr:gamma-glutamyl-gamma-aminobutyrate hydrolase family protein [Halonatronomonas betaini]MBF8437935.1 gamma-glutamyl-gamma-aminobutyrate hydrolase family protein [Halonatronomonas betaini]
MNKPVIGVTLFRREKDKSNSKYGTINCNYVRAIVEAGGIPLLIPIVNQPQDIKYYLELIDGLLLSGGQDISPEFYNEEPVDELGEIDPDRDSWELKLFTEAYKKKLPVLGICRGMQLINVALGGSLFQDIYSQYDDSLLHTSSDGESCAYHKIIIESGSKLEEILCCLDSLYVNSYHHQALKKPGKNLKVVARSDEGIIEAIEAEDSDQRFLVGVQWHPEDLAGVDDKSLSNHCFQQLFKSLISSAENNS